MRTPFACCVAGPTNKGEDNSKPVALSVFEFDFTKEGSVMGLHQ